MDFRLENLAEFFYFIPHIYILIFNTESSFQGFQIKIN